MRIYKFYFLSLLFTTILLGCKNYSENYKPHDLDDAIEYLDIIWSRNEKNNFKLKRESDAVLDLRTQNGRWIRNNWINGDSDSSLIKYFNSLGIYHADDMSNIILTSFHRKLNGKEIDLSGQVEHYMEYWKQINEYDKNIEKQALLQYNSFNIGNPIRILMKVDTSYGKRNAVVVYRSKNVWTYNPKVDLEIVGIVTNKYFRGDSSNVFFDVQINQLNPENTTIQMKKVRIGENVQFSLKSLLVSHP